MTENFKWCNKPWEIYDFKLIIQVASVELEEGELPFYINQALYVYVIFTWYGIRHSVMTTKPLCAFPATMPDITLNEFLTLYTIYQFFEKKWMYVITASICMTPYALHMTSRPLFMTSHHCSYHITSTALRTSHTQNMT